MIARDERPRMSSLYRIQFEPSQNHWLLLYPEGMLRLNQSAAEILQRCDGRRTVDELVAELEAVFAQPSLQEDIVGFLSHARQRGGLP